MSKTSLVVIMDIGKSMSTPPNGASLPPIVGGSIIAENVLMNLLIDKKTRDTFSLILVGTEDSENPLYEGGNMYQNISVIYSAESPSITHIRKIQSLKKQRSTHTGNLFHALSLAHHMLKLQCKKLKFTKRVFLVTDACSPLDKTLYLETRDQYVDYEIRLNVIGVNFHPEEEEEDDNSSKDNSTHEIPQNTLQIKNQSLLNQFCEEIDEHGGSAICFAMAEAQQILKQLKPKSVSSRRSFGFYLQITPHLNIRIDGFTKTAKSSIPLLSSRSTLATPDESGTIDRVVSYFHQGETDITNSVDKEFIVKGYSYGKTIIPLTALDMSHVNSPIHPPGINIIGCVKQSQIHPWFNCSNINILLPNESDKGFPQPGAKTGFCALVGSLIQTKYCLIATYVRNRSAKTKLVALIPQSTRAGQALLLIQLPFAEDIRNFHFPDPKDLVPDLVPNERQAIRDLILSSDLTGNHNLPDTAVPILVGLSETDSVSSSASISSQYFKFNPPIPSTTKNSSAIPEYFPIQGETREDFEDSDEDNIDQDGEVVLKHHGFDSSLFVPTTTFNPPIHYFYETLKQRALTQPPLSQPLDDPSPVLQNMLKPPFPPDFENVVKNVKAAFELKKVEKTAHGPKYRSGWSGVTLNQGLKGEQSVDKDTQSHQLDKSQQSHQSQLPTIPSSRSKRPLTFNMDSDDDEDEIESFLALDSLSGTSKVQHLNTKTPIQDFQKMLNQKTSLDSVSNALNEMTSIICRLVEGSVGQNLYGKARECVVALRKACVDHAEYSTFNTFYPQLFAQYGRTGQHIPFWDSLMDSRITLISYSEVFTTPEVVPISQAQADKYLETRGEFDIFSDSISASVAVDEEDILDDLYS